MAGVNHEAAAQHLALPESFLDPLVPVPWSTYAQLVDHLSAELGGDPALRRAAERFVDAVPDFAPIARQFLTPAAVMQFVILVMDPIVYPMIDHRLEDLGGGRFRIQATLRPGHRPCRSYFESSAGALRGMPRYLGLELGEVEAEVTETGADYRILFPPGAPRSPQTPPLGTDHPTLALMQHMGLAVVQQLGQQHRLAAQLEKTSRALETMVEETLAAVPNAAFLYSKEGGVRGANPSGKLALERDPSGVAETVRHALDHPGPGAPYATTDLLQGRQLLISRGTELDVQARLARIQSRWKLTPRQTEVLALLVQGHSNKEIARNLGCATKTVEIHLSHLLQKAGAESRLALLSTFWANSH